MGIRPQMCDALIISWSRIRGKGCEHQVEV